MSEQDENADTISTLLLLCYNGNESKFVEESTEDKYYLMEKSGLGSYEFNDGKFWFFAERNPRTGHHHCDRGSIVLEAFGETVLADPGATNYSNMLGVYMEYEDYHTLAHPDGIPMQVANPISRIAADEAGIGCRTVLTLDDFKNPETKVKYIKQIENGMAFSADMNKLFGEKTLKAVREGSFKKCDDFYELIINDEWEFTDKHSLYINFMSYGKWEINQNIAKMKINKVELILEFLSDNEFELSLYSAHLLQFTERLKLYRLERIFLFRVQTLMAELNL